MASIGAWTARGIGWILIALAIVSVPQRMFVMGRLATGIGWFSSVALALAGIVWLGAVEAAVFIFDRYPSRN